MSDEAWSRVKEVFHAAAALPPEERADFVDRACEGRQDLIAEIKSLLTSAEPEPSLESSPRTRTQSVRSAEEGLERPGDRVGHYKLLQLIGEGGFGLVYMAEQEHPVRRKVALKIVKPGMDTRTVIARFEQERQALAMMDHPNIARVLDAGQTQAGRPYFVMELVRGVPITEYCDANHLSLADRVRLFIPVCQAVQHAHTKGIIHRDIKPTNVMVTLHDGTPVPKVIDFGVAKAVGTPLTDKTLFTEFRQFIGTPEYMAPEQAALGGLDIDTRADVYSLGAVLYELLAGGTPLDGKQLRSAGMEELQRLIREQDPPRMKTRLSTQRHTAGAVATSRSTDLSTLKRLVAGELDWIVMRCLEKERTRRYESAGALGLDLARYLDNRPVDAGPPSTTYRIRKQVARNKLAFATAASILAALLVGLGAAVYGLLQAQHDRNEAVLAKEREAVERSKATDAERAERKARTDADHRADEARRATYRASLAAAAAALEQDNGIVARNMLEQAPEDLRGWEWKHQAWQADQSLAQFRTSPGHIGLFPMPDSRRTLVVPRGAKPELWDLDSGSLLRRFDVTADEFDLSPDGRLLACAEGRHLRVLDISTGQVLWELESKSPPGRPWLAGFSGGSDRVLARLSEEDRIEVIDARQGTILAPMRSARPLDVAIVVRPPDRAGMWRLGWWDRQTHDAVLIDPDTGHETRLNRPVYNVLLHQFFSAGSNQHLEFSEPLPNDIIAVLRTTTRRSAEHAALSQDRSTAASLDEAGIVTLWRLGADLSAVPAVALPGMEGQGSDIAFTPDGRRVIAADTSGAVKVWAVTNVPSPLTVPDQVTAAGPMGSAISRDGSILALGYWGTVEAWDGVSGRPRWRRSLSPYYLPRVAVSPDGRTVVAGVQHYNSREEGISRLRDLFVLDSASGQTLAQFSAGPALPDQAGVRPPPWEAASQGVEFSPDGYVLWVGCHDGSLHSIDTTSWQPLHSWSAAELAPDGAALSGIVALAPDGKHLALAVGSCFANPRADEPSGVRVFELPSMTPTRSIPITGAPPRTLRWTPDGRSVLLGDAFGVVHRLSVSDDAPVWERRLVTGAVSSVGVSPDGTRVLVGGADGNLHFLDAASGTTTLVMRGWAGVPTTSAWTADGSTVMVSGSRVVLRRLETGPPSSPSAGGPAATLRERDIVLQGQREIERLRTSGDPAIAPLLHSSRGLISLLESSARVPPDVRTSAIAHIRTLGESSVYAVSHAMVTFTNPDPDSVRWSVASVEDALTTDPTYPGLHSALGLLRLQQDRPAEALACFERSEVLSAQRGLSPRPYNLFGAAAARSALGQADSAALALAEAERAAKTQGLERDNLIDGLRARILRPQP